MSCSLTIIGKDLNVDAFVAKTNIPGFKKSYKGQPINRVNPKILAYSTASITTSNAGFNNIKTQIQETIAFLNNNKENIRHIVTTPEIEYATINFGADSLVDENHLMQSFYFTLPLLKICVELGIEIELSIYKPDMELILERKRKEK